VPASVEDAATMAVPDLAAHFFSGLRAPPAADYAPDLPVFRIDDAGHYQMRRHPDMVNHTINHYVRRTD
jgi:hypothetical protein